MASPAAKAFLVKRISKSTFTATNKRLACFEEEMKAWRMVVDKWTKERVALLKKRDVMREAINDLKAEVASLRDRSPCKEGKIVEVKEAMKEEITIVETIEIKTKPKANSIEGKMDAKEGWVEVVRKNLRKEVKEKAQKGITKTMTSSPEEDAKGLVDMMKFKFNFINSHVRFSGQPGYGRASQSFPSPNKPIPSPSLSSRAIKSAGLSSYEGDSLSIKPFPVSTTHDDNTYHRSVEISETLAKSQLKTVYSDKTHKAHNSVERRDACRQSGWGEIDESPCFVILLEVLRMNNMEGSTIGLLHHFMEEASKEIEASTILDGPIDGSRDVLEDTPKRDDIVYLVKKLWEWMKRPIHGFAALLHPAYKKPSLFSDQVLNEERMKYLPKVNVDECKLSVETLKSLNKDLDPEEEQIFRELYMELEEIDRRVSRTRARKVVVRGLATRGRGSSTSAVLGHGRALTRAPTTYVRRGSGSGSSTTATTLENVPLSRSTKPREPEFDDEDNILSEGYYGLSSTHSDPSSDEDDTHHDSDWEIDAST
ncbi:hypothetical protein L7F22_018772 [Adiantum nelumboides]|nr:hypothetical protein [Adiantum nelumboides]